ncbi:DUF3800 domain-containing protein [Paludibacter sp.]|uniref:DUF3800 domain-containing protein n=1 Tax=Paludibacter sp. TaxID=1898105 RepID=UPI0013530870|nr:DUF3800 domain-containing protein [Paludibacter sp.]MTK53748.1 DUF3800 domain-containing protein [Paludibacter sp.]
MINKTFNFYCDESCHLENDHFPFMLISYVSSSYNQVKIHSRNIRALKEKYFFKGEVKWSALSKSQYPFYKELIEYFFATDLQFRAIVIDKSQLKHELFHQTHDDFYDKMYFQLLSKKIFPEYNYNIYIDIKDTHSYEKAASLMNYLNRNFVSVRTLQVIRSYESELMQLTDVLMGAIAYHLRNEKRVIAKNKIIDRIQSHCPLPITQSTPKAIEKFNLFYIDLK